jgi:hypothetical protein
MAFDFEKLKSITKRLGGILVMNGNEPEFVIMPYEKFEAEGSMKASSVPSAPQTAPAEHQDDPLVDQLNNEILALKEEIRQKESSEAELI